MTHTIDLRPRLRLAAKAVTTHGWTLCQDRSNKGELSIIGAVMHCAPQTGDEYIIRGVLRKRNRAEAWNDLEATGADEVIDYLNTTDITDADLIDTFGPQALEFVALIRTMFTLTDAQWNASREATKGFDWSASQSFAWDASRYAARQASRDASRDAMWDVTRFELRDVTLNASLALHARDLIGQFEFTQEHYDALTGPWRKTIGKLHPDDADIYEGA